MRLSSPRWPVSLLALGLAVAAGALLGGCGKGSPVQVAGGGPARKLTPVTPQGAVSVVTRNTTRLGGPDVATDAAAIARTVYPGLTAASRPQAVILVDDRDWPAALAASSLASSPLGAPILYAEGNSLPAVTLQTLHALAPTGASALGGAQVIRIGTSAKVPGYLARTLRSGQPAVTAASVQQTLLGADAGKAQHAAIVVAATAPRSLTVPAAGLAAESGAPILFVTRGRVPDPTAGVLVSLHRPSIYVIDPAEVGRLTLHELHHYGSVTTIAPSASEGGSASASANSIAVARYTNGTFGWGVKEPGHGLVFANAARPLDGPAAALLSATGDYGPLLLLEAAAGVPSALAHYLGDIEPAYTPKVPAVKGLYNHGWLIGDERAISAVTQAEIDSLLEISPREETSEEASVSQSE